MPEEVGGKLGDTGEVSGTDLFVEVEEVKGKEIEEETERLRERERA